MRGRQEASAFAWVAEGVRVDVFGRRFGQRAWVGLERFVACVQRIIVAFVATLSLALADLVEWLRGFGV